MDATDGGREAFERDTEGEREMVARRVLKAVGDILERSSPRDEADVELLVVIAGVEC